MREEIGHMADFFFALSAGLGYAPSRMNIKFSSIILLGIPLLIVVLIVYGIVKNAAPIDTRAVALHECIQHTSIDMHYHPFLKIMVDGVEEKIPADIGVSDACMSPVHTHDDTGKLHVEYTRKAPFTLGDFYAVWGKSIVRDGYTMAMTVNGQASTEGDALVLKDADQIVVTYSADSVIAE